MRIREIAVIVKDIFAQLSSLTGNSNYKALSINISKEYPFSIAGINSSSTGTRENATGSIDLNVLFLLNPKEIPLKFHITNPDDPRLLDEAFLHDFIEWVKTHLKVSHSGFINIKEKILIRLFLLIINNPKLFRACRDFGLAHECAHLACNHRWKMHGKSLEEIVFPKLILFAVFGYGVRVIIQGVPLLPAMFLGVIVVGMIIRIAWSFFTRMQISRTCEYEADLYAKRIVGEAGGVLMFKGASKECKRLLIDSTISWWKKLYLFCLIDNNGELRLNLLNNHPRDIDRIKALMQKAHG